MAKFHFRIVLDISTRENWVFSNSYGEALGIIGKTYGNCGIVSVTFLNVEYPE